MTAKTIKYRLGLDLGTNSIGWAVIRLDAQGKPCGLVDANSRIFPDGRQADRYKTGRAPSNASQRRLARSARRGRDRYIKRRDRLMEALIAYGLMPSDDSEREQLADIDPYVCRDRAAREEPLAPYYLGRALFHINQRRGYQSNRLETSKGNGGNQQSGGKSLDINAEISHLCGEIQANGAVTLGQYLHSRKKSKKAGVSARARPSLLLSDGSIIPGIYPERRLYKHEFDTIRQAQSPHQRLTDEQWDHLREIIFFQRPLKPVDPGRCTLDPNEYRAPKALPLSQAFLVAQEVNNLRVIEPGMPERALTDSERKLVMDRLKFRAKERQKASIIKLLGLDSGSDINLVRDRKNLQGDETAAALRNEKIFGKKRWHQLSLKQQTEIVKAVLTEKDADTLIDRAQREWGLDEDAARSLSDVSLPKGYLRISEKALEAIVPSMEGQGLTWSEAVSQSRYGHHSDFRPDTALDYLPYYGKVLIRETVGGDPEDTSGRDDKRYGRIPNPTVHVGLNQLRHVVNALIETYGKPHSVNIELARQLKMSRQDRERLKAVNSANQERRDRCANALEEEFGKKPKEIKPGDYERFRLWEEQGKICPYSGKPIGRSDVFSNTTEVDHIIPLYVSLDDHISNKVLCFREENSAKDKRTPSQAFSGEKYEAILHRADSLPKNKRWRFHEGAHEQAAGGFLNRQLKETQWFARTARKYLAHLYNEREEARQRVDASTGRLTALLRHAWGLNAILSTDRENGGKNRDDLRHHAIDAFVVGMTTRGLVKAASKAAHDRAKDLPRLIDLFDAPWPGFDREEVRRVLERSDKTVSHRADHSPYLQSFKGANVTAGSLHEATSYGLAEEREPGQTQSLVHRKPLADFKSRDIAKVRDKALQQALQTLWDEAVGQRETPARVRRFSVMAQFEGVYVNGRRQSVRRARIVTQSTAIRVRVRKETAEDNAKAGHRAGDKYYPTGNNAFAIVWRMPNGEWEISVVSLYEASQPGFKIVDHRPHPGAKKLMLLHKNDLCAVGVGGNREIVCVKQIMKNTQIYFHDSAIDPENGGVKSMWSWRVRSLHSHQLRRIHVDVLGRFTDPGPME